MSRDAYPLYEKHGRVREFNPPGWASIDRARDLCYGSGPDRGGARVSYAYGLWALVRIGHRAVAWSWRSGARSWRSLQSGYGVVIGVERWPNT